MAREVTEEVAERIPVSEARNVVRRLAEGTVPDPGARLIAVGRTEEVRAGLEDLEFITSGGSVVRVVTGRFGAGKTFFLSLMGGKALDEGFVCAKADFGPSVHLAGVHALGVYRQLMASLSTRGRPGGGALEAVIQRWIARVDETVAPDAGDGTLFGGREQAVRAALRSRIRTLTEGLPNSHDWPAVLDGYYVGNSAGERELFVSPRTGRWELPSEAAGAARERDRRVSGDELRGSAIRWLRGEYARAGEARRDLLVSSIPTADTWFDMLRTLTAVAVDAGYRGMVVRLDELRHVLTNSAQIRQRNWEQVLNLYNAAGNGEVHNLGVILAATDYTVLDPRAGMYSYEALRTRLASSAWSRGEYGHQATPVVSLKQLTVNEQAVLLQRVDRCHRVATGRAVPVTLDDITLYLDRLNRRVGAGFGLESMVSMRDICRSWVDALNAWQAHPEVALSEILGEEARSAQRRSRMNFGEEAVMPQRELMVADSLPVFDPAAIAERECGVSALDAAPDLAADFGVVR